MNKQEKLEELYKKCIEELKSINIDVQKNRIIEIKIILEAKRDMVVAKSFQKIDFK